MATIGTLGKIVSNAGQKHTLYEVPVDRKGYIDLNIINPTGSVASCIVYILNDTDSEPASNINIVYKSEIFSDAIIGKFFVNSGYKIIVESNITGVIFNLNGGTDLVV